MAFLGKRTAPSTLVEMTVCAALLVAVITDSAHATTFHPCMPRKIMVNTHPTGMYVPYHYELHRCSGGTQNPGTHRCWPVDEDEVKVHLHNVDQERESVTLRNHTRCKEVCVCGPCKDHSAISVNNLCAPMERWDESSCRCVSRCIALGNVGHGPVRGNASYIALDVFIIAMVTEAGLLMGLIMVVRHCISRQRGKGKPNLNDIVKCETQEKCLLIREARGDYQERQLSGEDKISEPTAV